MLFLEVNNAWINPRYIIGVTLFHTNQHGNQRHTIPTEPTWHNQTIPNEPLYQRTESELDVRTKRGEIDDWKPTLSVVLHGHPAIQISNPKQIAHVMDYLQKHMTKL